MGGRREGKERGEMGPLDYLSPRPTAQAEAPLEHHVDSPIAGPPRFHQAKCQDSPTNSYSDGQSQYRKLQVGRVSSSASSATHINVKMRSTA